MYLYKTNEQVKISLRVRNDLFLLARLLCVYYVVNFCFHENEMFTSFPTQETLTSREQLKRTGLPVPDAELL